MNEYLSKQHASVLDIISPVGLATFSCLTVHWSCSRTVPVRNSLWNHALSQFKFYFLISKNIYGVWWRFQQNWFDFCTIFRWCWLQNVACFKMFVVDFVGLVTNNLDPRSSEYYFIMIWLQSATVIISH